MAGRFREICSGVNVDLGTAAAFREQWSQEAGEQRTNLPPIPLKLLTDQAPGDAVAMTAAIYSLHRAHPGRYLTAVESPWPEVFAYNPDVTPAPGYSELRMHYPAIHQSNDRAIHFMQGWCEHLGRALGVDVPLLTDRPRLYFDFATHDYRVGDFWVICSGGKRDFTNKQWPHESYQRVVGRLAGRVKFIQVGSASDDHPPLYGTDLKSMVGKTSLRQLFDLVRQSRGVLCGVSLLMHVAAALDKPCVVVAGGREPLSWNCYPRQTYVHTVGALPCSDVQGHVGRACWRSRVVPLGDSLVLDRDPCERPQNGVPECMRMISPESVAESVLRYDKQYAGRTE